MSAVLATGAAGLIDFQAAECYLKEDWEVVGLDNLNDTQIRGRQPEQMTAGMCEQFVRLYNIGNNKSILLTHLIAVLEQCLGTEAKKELVHSAFAKARRRIPPSASADLGRAWRRAWRRDRRSCVLDRRCRG
jgi:hypothetical protein